MSGKKSESVVAKAALSLFGTVLAVLKKVIRIADAMGLLTEDNLRRLAKDGGERVIQAGMGAMLVTFEKERKAEEQQRAAPAVTPLIDCDAPPNLPPAGVQEFRHRKGGKLPWQPDKIFMLPPTTNGTSGTSVEQAHLAFEESKIPVLNKNVADFLVQRPEYIPKTCKGKHVLFLGTWARDGKGVWYVPVLYENGNNRAWTLGWQPMHKEVGEGYLIAALKNW